MQNRIEKTIEILGDLVAFPSVSGRPNGDIIGYIKSYLETHGIEALLDVTDDGTQLNLFATIGPAIDGGIILSGHTDVVPAAASGWTSDPFTLRRDNGRLYGRGAVDMKGFVAIALAMVPDIVAVQDTLTAPVHLAFTFDEEVGCFGSARMPAFLAQHNIFPEMAIIGEPTEMRPFIGHKGGMELRTQIIGTAGHASKPSGKVNAIYGAAKMINFINQIADELAGNPDPSSPFDPPYTSLSVGQIIGGEARNVIPASCQFDWEIRPLPDEDSHQVLARINEYAETVLRPELRAISPEADIVTTIICDVPGMEARPHSVAANLIARLWTRETPDVVSFGTDGAYFQQAGMETIVFGPGGMAQMHQPDEYIEEAALGEGLQFLDRVLDHLCQTPKPVTSDMTSPK
jgi:acetylornithine deacetylase